MKKLLLVIAILLCFGFAYAEQTTDTKWNDPELIEALKDYAGADVEHQHEYKEYETPAGIGVDLILWNFNEKAKLLRNVKAETKYDFNNEVASVFVVVTLDLPSLFNK